MSLQPPPLELECCDQAWAQLALGTLCPYSCRGRMDVSVRTDTIDALHLSLVVVSLQATHPCRETMAVSAY